MGISTLLILLCHSIAYIKVPVVLHYAISFSNIGVDFFLFLSGMGLWYSLSSSTKGMARWYADRYKKLLIPYFTVLLFIEILQFAAGKQIDGSIWNYLFYITSLSFYVSHNAAWFIAALIPLYLLAPWFYCLIKKYQWIASLGLIIIHYLILFIHPLYTTNLINDILQNIQFVVIRSTSFILGMSLGRYIQNNEKISIKWLIGACVMGGVIIIITKHLVYAYFFFSLPLLCGLCYIFQKSGKWMRHFLNFMGKISLESYLLNGTLPKIMIMGFISLHMSTLNNIIPYIFACGIGVLLSYIFHNVSSKIITFMIKK